MTLAKKLTAVSSTLLMGARTSTQLNGFVQLSVAPAPVHCELLARAGPATSIRTAPDHAAMRRETVYESSIGFCSSVVAIPRRRARMSN
ncbi:MAG: hypothetical protein K2Y51_10395 [Gammaproteobacteria bacterium]|nr:hypothetical protein [Gammaproteobacteria bacterium]